ncbi:hypothetical protein DICPUDRAFT_26301 [Dictyostelium purpureum]|uniref:Uncharacterized protein n=1 Tax=Dictyostelium purpureum TaxID=5786 RepID=F0Z8F7_DICPU|nr:uncharacterized protein DICPUDRAFT_26301 [Dictyostelium purpureum]EGC39715.1 hypothetical protein DICPUDRAFT_26301 [Dictyostelium purpureum]|eukprot:XP_003283701.1 hypothetical protein DICPUDRAFT_26301 [Dictyostelium purpureum]
MKNEQMEQRKIIKDLWVQQSFQFGETVNIISMIWLRQWKNYVKYDESPLINGNGNNSENGHNEQQQNGKGVNHHHEFESPKPETIDNRELLEGIDSEGNPIMDRKLNEKTDFEIVPSKVWSQLIQWYQGGPEIKRTVITLGFKDELYVEIKPYLINVKYHTSLISEIPSRNQNQQQQQTPYLYSYQRSLKSTLAELRETIAKNENINPNHLEFYKNSTSGKSKPIKKITMSLEDLKFEDKTDLILHYQTEQTQKGISKLGKKITGIFKKKGHGSGMGGRSYSDPSYYTNGVNGGGSSSSSSSTSSNSNESSPTFENIDPKSSKEIVLSNKICGLSNLGNTCFMNSSLQCLAHTIPLTEYFLSGKYACDINKTNPLGMKGQIAEIYGKLMKDMWTGSSNCVAPKHLKWIIGKYAPQFSGMSQQDSQEFLSFLLDGLHEDLNKVLKKPYTEEKEESKEQREDAVVAAEHWENHIKRNQSIIVNLFQGQYKSTLTCSKCSKVSITFDPYMYVTLPIPVPTERLFDVILFRRKPIEQLGPDPNGIYCLNNAMAPIKYCLKLPKREDVETLRVELSKITGIESSCIALAETLKNRIYTFLNDQKSLLSIKDKEVTIAYELPHAGEDISRIHVMHRSNGDLALLPYVLLLKYSETSRKDLYKMVWERVGHRVKKGWRSALRQKLKEQQNLNLENNSNNSSTTTVNDQDQDNISNQQEQHQQHQQQQQQFGEKDSHHSTFDDSQFEEDDASSVTDDDLFESIYPFVLKTTNGNGNHCDRCPNGCTGCAVECDDKPLTILYKTPKYWREGCNNIAIDWRPEIIKYVDFIDHDDPTSPFTIQDKSIQLKSEFRNDITLYDCLSIFTKNEELKKNDTWYCPDCKAHIEATKKLELWSAPKILVIHLKRFQYTSYTHRHEKINYYVDFPLDNLDISKLVLNKSYPPPVYQLYAISNHMGVMGSGHYTSCVKNKDQWYLISDSSYRPIDKLKIKSSDAYVLFYQLKSPPTGTLQQ